jgi:hypothetical protein
MYKYNLLAANMRRMNATMHALLNQNMNDDLLFIQEPWFGTIGNTRTDTQRTGTETLGGAAHPTWNLVYPIPHPGTTT